MEDDTFEWDDAKAAANVQKHGVTFSAARDVFEDPHRLIRRDIVHSSAEQRYYCIGRVDEGILTVRFTLRGYRVRIIGAGYWRKGRAEYEKENQIHG